MARIYAINEDHNCDFGVDFINGAAAVPDANTDLVAWFTHKGYTVVAGQDVLSPWDYLTRAELASFAPYGGIDSTGLSKSALVATIEAQLALMKIEITQFTAIANIGAGRAGATIYANANAVKAVLPTTVLCNAGTLPIPVTAWVDTDTYNPAVAGSYTFTATLGALPAPYANTAAGTATAEVIVAEKQEITSFVAIADVDGGILADPTYANAAAVIAALPTSVSANNGAVTVPVTTWVDTDTYNSAAAAKYTFTATLGIIPGGWANTGNFTATVEVEVKAA